MALVTKGFFLPENINVLRNTFIVFKKKKGGGGSCSFCTLVVAFQGVIFKTLSKAKSLLKGFFFTNCGAR